MVRGTERQGREGERQDHAQPAHYEETLANPATERRLLAGFVGLFVVPMVVVDLAALAGAVRLDAGALVVGNVVVAAFGAVLWRGYGTEVSVRVTDGGVAVRQTPAPLWGSGAVFVPFEAVESVRVSEPGDGRISVTNADRRANRESVREDDGLVTFNTAEHRPQTFKVTSGPRQPTTYDDGVRIGREDAPPVYVGSGRPRELATAIVERAPAVGSVERL